MIPSGGALLQMNFGRWKKALCMKIGNNEIELGVDNESLMPLDYTRHTCMYFES